MSELERLEQGLAAGQGVSLSPEADAAPIAQLPPCPGVLVRSGGSRGGSRCCAQPSLHLDRSAAATAHWLTGIGVDPASTLLRNPLPLAHVSGLMPWWRSRCWGVGHPQLPSGMMKTPTELLAFCQGLPAWGKNPAVLSLVPTQLARLLAHPDGVAFLQQLQLIWIGGAALPAPLAEQARALQLPLAPCYGSTETAAMVAAMPPKPPASLRWNVVRMNSALDPKVTTTAPPSPSEYASSNVLSRTRQLLAASIINAPECFASPVPPIELEKRHACEGVGQRARCGRSAASEGAA